MLSRKSRKQLVELVGHVLGVEIRAVTKVKAGSRDMHYDHDTMTFIDETPVNGYTLHQEWDSKGKLRHEKTTIYVESNPTVNRDVRWDSEGKVSGTA